jgi:hypothetical protein
VTGSRQGGLRPKFRGSGSHSERVRWCRGLGQKVVRGPDQFSDWVGLAGNAPWHKDTSCADLLHIATRVLFVMPIRCVDPTGQSIHSFDLSEDEWKSLELENKKSRHLSMPCCAAHVTLKRSRLGSRFFAHKAVGSCTSARETEEHLHLKQMAVMAARAHGWTAQTEVTGTTPTGEEWRADVLATKGEHRVAVEIQWSGQTTDETIRRQTQYKDSDVRGL